ncbi:hypothetical protein [Methanocella sp. MCL-LM]
MAGQIGVVCTPENWRPAVSGEYGLQASETEMEARYTTVTGRGLMEGWQA